jgi:cytochrome c biogenesis protein CcmG/thiol:disulfide interchange protein DsbE
MSSDSENFQRDTDDVQHGSGGLGKRLVFLLPVLIFLVIAAYFLWGLQPERDPRKVPTALIDKAVPQFQLPAIPGLDVPGVETADLTGAGQPVLLNVFASWCVPCRVEHPILMRLAKEEGVAIYGVNYKDRPADARKWLADFGNPYSRIGRLSQERAEVGIELGVYGVPETYVVGPDGRIRYKHVGPIQPKSLREDILPLLEELRGGI